MICLTNRRLLPNHAQQSHCFPWVSKGGSIQWLPHSRNHAPGVSAHSSSLCPIKPSIWASENTITCRVIYLEAVYSLCHWNRLCCLWSLLPKLLYPFVSEPLKRNNLTIQRFMLVIKVCRPISQITSLLSSMALPPSVGSFPTSLPITLGV